VIITWDIRTQKIVSEVILPFIVHSLNAFQGQSPVSQHTFNYIFLQSTYVENREFHNLFFFNIENNSFQVVEERVPSSIHEISWKLSAKLIDPDDLISCYSYESVRRVAIQSKEAVQSPTKFFELFPNGKDDSQTLNLTVLFHNHHLKSTNYISFMQFTPTLEIIDQDLTDPTSFPEVKLVVPEFKMISAFNLLDEYANQHSTLSAVPMSTSAANSRSRVVSAIEFNSDYSTFFLVVDSLGIFVFSLQPTTLQINKIAEFFFDPRVFAYHGLHFLNTNANDRRYGELEFSPDKKISDLIVINPHHLIGNHPTLLIWNYRKDIITNTQNSSAPLPAIYSPETVSLKYQGKGHHQNQQQQQQQQLHLLAPKSVVAHTFFNSFQKIFIQPLKTNITNQSLNENRIQLIFGMDSSQRLWSCHQLFFSNFAGAMFPIGYRIIDQIQYYIEREDELDTIIKPSSKKSTSSQDAPEPTIAPEPMEIAMEFCGSCETKVISSYFLLPLLSSSYRSSP
jgi:hypothetical protein